jgi:hypothetical protein
MHYAVAGGGDCRRFAGPSCKKQHCLHCYPRDAVAGYSTQILKNAERAAACRRFAGACG